MNPVIPSIPEVVPDITPEPIPIPIPEPEPIPEPYPPKIQDMHWQALQLWHWFVVKAWDRENQREAESELLKTLQRVRKCRFSATDTLLWLAPNYYHPADAPLLGKSPWESRKEGNVWMYSLDMWNGRFFELFKSYLLSHQMCDLDAEVQFFMRKRYQLDPFQNNDQGIVARDMWDKKIFPYQVQMVKKIMDCYKVIYETDEGYDYSPWVKVANEWGHSGNADKFHKIMFFHRDIYESVLRYYTKLNRVCVDVSLSEGAIAELMEPHKCPKCPEKHGKPEYNRLAVPEWHGFSTKEDFVSEEFLKGKDKVRKYTEDGGSKTKSGKGTIIGTRNWGSAQQQYDMALYMWKEASRKGKRVIYGSIAPESHIDENGMLVFPDYTEHKIYWGRYEKIGEAHDKVYT